MTKSTGQRLYRACTRCRAKKAKCELQNVGGHGQPPCIKCTREGSDCVLADSRRGGDYTHLRRRFRTRSPFRTRSAHQAREEEPPRAVKPQDSAGFHDSLQNPTDALLLLASVVGDHASSMADASSESPIKDTTAPSRTTRNPHNILHTYPPLREGTLTLGLLYHLLTLYSHHYHPFLPIVPSNVLQSASLASTIEHEPFLLTAILVVASRDRPDLASFHRNIWEYMRQQLLDVVLGTTHSRSVGCVEGLLLLGEWTPASFSGGHSDNSSEGTAWTIIGLAVRLAYLLRLEDSAFKSAEPVGTEAQRERLAWIFTYLADRQISIRMGNAFWCRGPSLSARFTAADFTCLQPRFSYEEDFASMIQAKLELTTLFGNAHDILFASKQRTRELMVRGDYVKYIDDTTKSIATWKCCWTELRVSRHLKACLGLMEQYLHLYVNAFAFQAVLYRKSVDKVGSGASCFPASAMASPDARHIYQAIDAAENLLRTVVEEIEPENHLRYLPACFYLYEIHSAVFLFKAHVCGALHSEAHTRAASLVQQFIEGLNRAAPDPSHIAARYARLLQELWFTQGNGAITPANASQAVAMPTATPQLLSPRAASLDPVANSLFDTSGLAQFDGFDSIEGLFWMPSFSTIDQC